MSKILKIVITIFENLKNITSVNSEFKKCFEENLEKGTHLQMNRKNQSNNNSVEKVVQGEKCQ